MYKLFQITKITKFFDHDNLELYGMAQCKVANVASHVPTCIYLFSYFLMSTVESLRVIFKSGMTHNDSH